MGRTQRRTSDECFVRTFVSSHQSKTGGEIKAKQRSRPRSRADHLYVITEREPRSRLFFFSFFLFPRTITIVGRSPCLQAVAAILSTRVHGSALQGRGFCSRTAKDGGLSRTRISRSRLPCADGSLPRLVFRQRPESFIATISLRARKQTTHAGAKTKSWVSRIIKSSHLFCLFLYRVKTKNTAAFPAYAVGRTKKQE